MNPTYARFRFLAPLVFATVAAGCATPRVSNHSFSRVDEVVVTHLDLDLVVDFGARKIRGSVTHQIENKMGTDRLYLDTKALRILDVKLDGSERATFELGRQQGYLGQPLVVRIHPHTKSVTVQYETTEGATAVDWLSPAQTADGRMPFMYTQGQAILNRTWIPCQDNTAVRVTYGARIRVPEGMMAVMSARNPAKLHPDGVYTFDMPQPIPPYLIALAAGDIAFRPIGKRSGVYAEPGVVDKAAWEFADTESMIESAEKLYGPYRWERFDVIVLPPSFPYGGMENPRLTFLTPVLVAGDRSLVSTIAHELAHSWSGNLVTNATWDDFWLNEGFTTYFERRIMEAIYGRDAMEMQASLGFTDLDDALGEYGADSPDTRLHNATEGHDPDEVLSSIPYEKGYLFLRLIEETVGREKFDAFLRGYFDRFAFQTMTSDRFVAYLRRELIKGDAALGEKLRIDEWVYAPGLPDNHPVIRSVAFEHVADAVDQWNDGAAATLLPAEKWSSQEWRQFLLEIPKPQDPERLAELDRAYHLSSDANGEVKMDWFVDTIAAGYEPAYPAIEAYLTKIGRIWLIGTVYRELVKTPEGRERAREIFAKARAGYHPLAVAAVEQIVNGGS